MEANIISNLGRPVGNDLWWIIIFLFILFAGSIFFLERRIREVKRLREEIKLRSYGVNG
jgi:hypothetical protein